MDQPKRFCDNCGNEIPNNVRFCIYCGHQLSDIAQTNDFQTTVSKRKGNVKPLFYILCVLAVVGGVLAGSVLLKDTISDLITNEDEDYSFKTVSSYEISSGNSSEDNYQNDSTTYSRNDYQTITTTQSYEEKIMNGAFQQSYIDVYPENVDYLPSVIDIWNSQAGPLLNLRSGPGTKYALIDQIKDGEKVITLYQGKNDYDFCYYTQAHEYGWLLSKYVKLS